MHPLFSAIVGKIFRFRIAVPLSKVTYGIYLVHFILQMADQAKVKIPESFLIYDMVSFKNFERPTFVMWNIDNVYNKDYTNHRTVHCNCICWRCLALSTVWNSSSTLIVGNMHSPQFSHWIASWKYLFAQLP